MTSEQRRHIRDLVKKYSDSGTESLIAFVAETNGMLASCLALLQSLDAVDSTSIEWLQRECADENVTFHAFLQEVTKIAALFQPSLNIEDHHATLGVSANAGPDEIKQAYRILSLRYHPDTAAPPYRDNPEKFIAINKAYNALLSADTSSEKDESAPPAKQWRRKKERSVSPEQRKKVFTWSLGLLIVLVVVSAIASMSYQKRAMLAGLKESRGAFIPTAQKAAEISIENKDVVETQPNNPPGIDIPTTSLPGNDLAAKVQPEREDDPFELQQELPRKDFIKTSIKLTSAAKKSNPEVHQPIEARPEPALKPPAIERKETNILADKSANPDVPERVTSELPPPVKASSGKISKKAAEQHAMVETKATKKRDSEPLPAQKEQTATIEPDVVFKIATPHTNTRITESETEKDMLLAGATVKEISPTAAAPPPDADKKSGNKPSLQSRLDNFFVNYIDAYEQRNLILFSRYFDGEAEENGKPFTSMLPTYLDLFAKTRRISIQIEQRSSHLVDGMIAVDGQFKVLLEYIDSGTTTGSGPIHFLLSENDSEMLIKKMDYVFHAE